MADVCIEHMDAQRNEEMKLWSKSQAGEQTGFERILN